MIENKFIVFFLLEKYKSHTHVHTYE